jgi:hypothetical protein
MLTDIILLLILKELGLLYGWHLFLLILKIIIDLFNLVTNRNDIDEFEEPEVF